MVRAPGEPLVTKQVVTGDRFSTSGDDGRFGAREARRPSTGAASRRARNFVGPAWQDSHDLSRGRTGHYLDGRRILTFDPLFPGDEDGIPDDYLADRIELGLVGGASKGGLAAALLLAERITEVRPSASSGIAAAHGVLGY
ncbi:hypothetical protein Misp01_51810 [Microtetraspora sp. NBRC 13810]|uniref:hypothetical protein n=1 Tax=Microtetraspora sp. NBRC 13810 TaxID=3030990 RepID=UPI0024A44466|nr:hypothetical protein [Microtetraspora sp. NBRC 13810]GLW10052.1 hypothetical protein Misp01_51810 [Microtetraspora sp. NBRC 13810]